jgi:demethylmenaquinone methyltransferase/2-methoxy-6-polyprenyl-1,4-benzoquinol methylase
LGGEVWKDVVRAIEESIPEYDLVNEKVSLGHAQRAREYAVEQLNLPDRELVLDAGVGPGTMSELLISNQNKIVVVGLDASVKLLTAAKRRFSERQPKSVHLVRGVFEALPFRDGCFQRLVSAYAFRDSRDRETAIAEFARVSSEEAIFAIVDLGKPDNTLKRLPITIYVRFFIPLIAWLSKSRAVEGNPWKMIFPTYQALVTNGTLISSLKKYFPNVRMTAWGLGGVIVVIAQKTT